VDAGPAALEICAAQVRAAWNMPSGPIPDMVGALERHGIVCARYHAGTQTVDAFSVPFSERPIVVLGDDKAKRDREGFSAAHELGHLVMHELDHTGTKGIENQANRFAAAFIMPADDIRSVLPPAPAWNELLILKPLGRAHRRAPHAGSNAPRHAGISLCSGHPLHERTRMADHRTRRPRCRRSTTNARTRHSSRQ
jgi:hypothetical protein